VDDIPAFRIRAVLMLAFVAHLASCSARGATVHTSGLPASEAFDKLVSYSFPVSFEAGQLHTVAITVTADSQVIMTSAYDPGSALAAKKCGSLSRVETQGLQDMIAATGRRQLDSDYFVHAQRDRILTLTIWRGPKEQVIRIHEMSRSPDRSAGLPAELARIIALLDVQLARCDHRDMGAASQ
jgi:hypothetical protein